MQPTRTTAKVLVGVAVAALTGCVSVEGRPPAPVPAAPEVARPVQDVAPQIVEGPAREALEAALPSRPPATVAARPPRPRAEPRPAPAAPRPQSPRRAPTRERPRERVPAVRLPAVPVPRGIEDACALGESYGRWRPDSQEARICRGVYGR
ncbi:hypothetical protein [Streptomyces sp. SP18CS02]|uniref:hypothetical protein n=1 Tax=Streptomyces sp. SP18CS02 TaxID=3002531 RepID=UPI002E7858EE|nr:hypothetical protein [Streptomyces sp. SP18CS02]MEE1755494.1 hypothetical protein [Streptomyces sp. SP18CS02]